MKALNNILATFVVIGFFGMTIRALTQLIRDPGYGILIIFVILLIISFISTAVLFDTKDNDEHEPPDTRGAC